MNDSQRLGLILGAMNLVAAGAPIIADQAAAAAAREEKTEVLNTASLQAIESTWLKIPTMCKARHFNADPVPQTRREARPEVQALYASFEA